MKRPLTVAGLIASRLMLCEVRDLAKQGFYRLPASGRRNLISLMHKTMRRGTEASA